MYVFIFKVMNFFFIVKMDKNFDREELEVFEDKIKICVVSRFNVD